MDIPRWCTSSCCTLRSYASACRAGSRCRLRSFALACRAGSHCRLYSDPCVSHVDSRCRWYSGPSAYRASSRRRLHSVLCACRARISFSLAVPKAQVEVGRPCDQRTRAVGPGVFTNAEMASRAPWTQLAGLARGAEIPAQLAETGAPGKMYGQAELAPGRLATTCRLGESVHVPPQ